MNHICKLHVYLYILLQHVKVINSKFNLNGVIDNFVLLNEYACHHIQNVGISNKVIFDIILNESALVITHKNTLTARYNIQQRQIRNHMCRAEELWLHRSSISSYQHSSFLLVCLKINNKVVVAWLTSQRSSKTKLGDKVAFICVCRTLVMYSNSQIAMQDFMLHRYCCNKQVKQR